MPTMTGTIIKPRRPWAQRVAAWRVTPRVSYFYRKLRRPILYLAGFGCLDAAAWYVHVVAGLLAIGITMFILEALSSDGRST